mgnify:CR=1 FL=1
MISLAVALIGATGVVLAAMISNLKKRNGKEHAEKADRLDRVIEGIGRVEQKIDHHLEHHQ